jgi:hypothetical protein
LFAYLINKTNLLQRACVSSRQREGKREVKKQVIPRKEMKEGSPVTSMCTYSIGRNLAM